ncbi:hypothetical protein ABPG75_004838 [Micractinium tetrahymenae]
MARVKRRLAEHASLTPEEEEYVSGVLDALYSIVPRRQHAYVTEHYFGGGSNGIAWVESMTHGLASDGDVSAFFKGTLENNPADCEDAEYILAQYKEKQRKGAFKEEPRMEGLAQLRGPWAFVVFDRSRGRILAARDPAGAEPLFWGTTLLSEGVLFASEKSLIEGECVDADAFPPGCIFVSDDFSTQGRLSPICTDPEAAEQRQQAEALCRVESSSQLQGAASQVSAN